MRVIAAILVAMLCACDSDSATHQAVNQPTATRAGPIVFLGDSITQLWPLDDFVPGAINAGASGEDTYEMIARFERDVLSLAPSVVVILAGTNDIRDRDSADTERLFEMVARAKAADIRVIVGTIPPMDINLGAYPEVEKQLVLVLNDKIRKGAAVLGYDVVDYHRAFIIESGELDTRLYADAWLHPNRAGYEAMWSVLQPVISHLSHL